MHEQIMDYLYKSNLLDPYQKGYKKFSSTETALSKLTNDIRMGMSKKLITVLLQFDFSKAFDTISPAKLLVKLKQMGFSRTVLMWLKSYLHNR